MHPLSYFLYTSRLIYFFNSYISLFLAYIPYFNLNT